MRTNEMPLRNEKNGLLFLCDSTRLYSRLRMMVYLFLLQMRVYSLGDHHHLPVACLLFGCFVGRQVSQFSSAV